MRNLGLVICVMAIAACGPPAAPDRGDDGGLGGDGGGGEGGDPTCPQTCSSDMKSVVDCHGNPISACPAGTACGNGVCGEPCAAAAANKSSIGCDYYAVAPDVLPYYAGGCFAAYIANTWNAPVTIAVERDGVPLSVDSFGVLPSGQGQAITYTPLVNGVLPAGQVAILFLARFGTLSSSCPSGITPAVTATDAAVHGTGRGHAFHITTSAPTVAYDIYPYGGGSSAITSATLLLPTSAWDTRYIAADAYARSQINEGIPFIEIVAQHDATSVTLRPTVAIDGGGGIAPSPAGTPVSFMLDAGEVLQFTQPAELAGSPITADKAIGVWGGATCLNIGVSIAACDMAHQQIPPLQAMGHRYAAVRHRDRYPGVTETVPWRLVGAVDGTVLTYTPSPPAGAPTTLALGQVVELTASSPFVVTSQDAMHPFYMSSHMTGCFTHGNQNDCRGDPEYVGVVPPEQYLSAYTFFTDPTYPETHLVLTRERRNGVYADVTIDCAGTVTGWAPIDANDTMQYARVDLVTGNFSSVNGCNNGLHVATSTQPFGLVVWGWGSAATGGFYSQAVSYAYPAGASVKPINTVVIY